MTTAIPVSIVSRAAPAVQSILVEPPTLPVTERDAVCWGLFGDIEAVIHARGRAYLIRYNRHQPRELTEVYDLGPDQLTHQQFADGLSHLGNRLFDIADHGEGRLAHLEIARWNDMAARVSVYMAHYLHAHLSDEQASQ